MKINKIILPLVMLLAIPSCGAKEDPKVKDGAAPSGGEKITDRALADEALGTLTNKLAFNLEEETNFYIYGLFDEFNANMNSERFNSNLKVEDFETVVAATNLFKENSKDVKAALSFTGSTLSYKVDAVPEDTSVEETHWNESVEFGGITAYVNQGDLFIDASEAKPFDTAKGVIRAIKPFYSLYANRNPALKLAEPLVDALANADTQKVNDALNDFGNKFKFEGVDLSELSQFASVIKNATDDDVNKAAQKVKKLVKDNYGIDLDAVASFYTYKYGGKAIELKLTEDELINMINPDDVEYYNLKFSDSFFNIAIYFNEDGFPTSISTEFDIEAVSETSFFDAIIGGPLTMSTSGGFDAYLDNEVKDIEMPSDLSSYKTLTSLILKLVTSNK